MKKPNNKTDEEVVYDDSDIHDTADSGNISELRNKLKKIKDDLKKCQLEKQEYLNGWQRQKADFINFKKRTEESKQEFIKYANENFILQLLTIVDNFDQAFKDKKTKPDENWQRGIELIYQQITNLLKENNVFEIVSLDKEFDPKIHECVEVVKVDEKKDNDKILEITQKGYKIGDKIIRHPRVKIGKIDK